jgi:hypothetical protein
MFLMFCSCLFAVIMAVFGEKELYRVPLFKTSLRACSTASCKGNGAVYRVSFTLFLFFLVHSMAVKKWMPFHWSWLNWKILMFIIVLIVTFFIPASFFRGYAEFARVASVFFLIIQVIVLLLWAMETADELQWKIDQVTEKVQNEEYEDEELAEAEMKAACCNRVILLLVTFGSLAVCITVWVFCFIWFGNDGAGCEGKETLIGVSIVLVIAIYALTLYAKHGSLFTTGIVALYVTYLLYSGLSSAEGSKCNQLARRNERSTMWLGIVFTALSLSYIGFSVSKNFTLCFDDDGPPEEEAAAAKASGGDGVDLEVALDAGATEKESNYDDLDEDADKKKKKKKSKSDDTGATEVDEDMAKYSAYENDVEQKQNFIFHVCMTFASLYVAMLYTNWATASANDSTARGRGSASLAVNIAAMFLVFGLYCWLLAAPMMFPDRFKHVDEEE